MGKIRAMLVPAEVTEPVREIKVEQHYGADDDLTHVIGGWIEIVRPWGLVDWRNVVMIVDEEFLLKDLPLNPRASWLYQTQKHGHPICGDVVLVGEDFDPLEGLDVAPLPAEFTAETLRGLLPPGMR